MMQYTSKATAKTPAHIIFLIDISESMLQPCYGQPRINVVANALTEVIFHMMDLSTIVVGDQPEIRPRFRVAILGYNEQVYDPYGGFMSIDKLAQVGVPSFQPAGETNMFLGFQAIERLLDQLLNTPNSAPASLMPAPLVCHLTDMEYNKGNSPLALAERIKSRQTSDGSVLIENIFISDTALRTPISSIEAWQGVGSESELQGNFAVELFRMSSEIPATYLETIKYWGFNNIRPGSRLMFPGANPDLIKTALVTTGSSGGASRQSIPQ
jgi:hypothetical protein